MKFEVKPADPTVKKLTYPVLLQWMGDGGDVVLFQSESVGIKVSGSDKSTLKYNPATDSMWKRFEGTIILSND